MQVPSRYKWVFILGFILVFITILMITLAYLVSERLIHQLDEEGVPVGVMIHPNSIDEIKVWGELCLHFVKTNTFKTI